MYINIHNETMLLSCKTDALTIGCILKCSRTVKTEVFDDAHLVM